MKKVLYITTVSRTINAFLVPHIEMLLSNENKVDCACSIDNSVDKRLLAKGVHIYDVPFSRSPFNFNNIKAFLKLKSIQEINQYDIIHVHTPIAALYGRLLKFCFPKVKTIYTAHGYHFLKGGSKLGWLIYYPIEKLMANFSDVIININKEDFDITKKKLNPKKAFLLNGVGLELSKYKKLNEDKISKKRKELNIDENEFVVLMIAEINKNKNHIQLINAMELLKDKYPEIKVLCVGEGSLYKEIKEEIALRGLKENIKLLGFRNDINELINISDLGILLSHREGLPRNIMEFMACGRKVIATDIRGCRDIICDSTVGTLVKVNDYKETANAIEKYYLEKDRQFEISPYINKYDVKDITDKLLNIYKDIERGQYFGAGVPSYIIDK